MVHEGGSVMMHGARLAAQLFLDGVQQFHRLVDGVGFAAAIGCHLAMQGFKLEDLLVQALGVDILENDGIGKHDQAPVLSGSPAI